MHEEVVTTRSDIRMRPRLIWLHKYYTVHTVAIVSKFNWTNLLSAIILHILLKISYFYKINKRT